MEFVIIHLNSKKNRIVLRKFSDYEGIISYIDENEIPDDEYSIIVGNKITLFK